MKALRKLVLGETWALPLGVFATLALAVVLLVGAMLAARSFHALSRVDPGFAAEGAMALELPGKPR